jgi:hypothetical protein
VKLTRQPQIMANTQRRPTGHTDWCGGARTHRCGVNEHRSPDQIVDGAVGGRAVITRVRAGDVEYVEVYARIPLHRSDTGARWQVAETLRWMRALLAAVAIRPGVLRGQAERPAVSGRKAIER